MFFMMVLIQTYKVIGYRNPNPVAQKSLIWNLIFYHFS